MRGKQVTQILKNRFLINQGVASFPGSVCAAIATAAVFGAAMQGAAASSRASSNLGMAQVIAFFNLLLFINSTKPARSSEKEVGSGTT